MTVPNLNWSPGWPNRYSRHILKMFQVFGSISWIDVEREYGGLVIFENYPAADQGVIGVNSVRSQLIPIIEDALDAAR